MQTEESLYIYSAIQTMCMPNKCTFIGKTFHWHDAGDYQPGDVLGGRYKVLGVMGRGEQWRDLQGTACLPHVLFVYAPGG